MQEAINKIKNDCECEINKGKIYIGFYKRQELKADKETSAKIKLKRMQVEDAVNLAQGLLEYVNTL